MLYELLLRGAAGCLVKLVLVLGAMLVRGAELIEQLAMAGPGLV